MLSIEQDKEFKAYLRTLSLDELAQARRDARAILDKIELDLGEGYASAATRGLSYGQYEHWRRRACTKRRIVQEQLHAMKNEHKWRKSKERQSEALNELGDDPLRLLEGVYQIVQDRVRGDLPENEKKVLQAAAALLAREHDQ